jgi:hypothetical protein
MDTLVIVCIAVAVVIAAFAAKVIRKRRAQ